MSSIGAEDHPRLARAIALPAIPVALIVAIVALWLSGSAAASTLGDPGALTRWGLPIARMIHDGSMALTIGCLVFVVAVLPRTTRPHRAEPGSTSTDSGSVQPAFNRVLSVAAGSAAVWTLAAAAVAVLSYSDASAIPISADPTFTQGLGEFLTTFDQGKAWAAVTVLAALVTTLAFALRSPAGLAWSAGLAIGGIVPLALIGHASGGDDHWGAVNSIGLHLLGVCIWTGGIGALAVTSGLLGARMPSVTRSAGRKPGAKTDSKAGSKPVQDHAMAADVLARFSQLATASILLVIGSGIASAYIRVHTIAQLATAYGALLIAKFFLSLVLGLLGLLHRRWIIPRLREGVLSVRRAAWSIVAVETVLMGAVLGLATTLARTAPPISTDPPTDMSPARRLTGYELPPALGQEQWFTVWRFDWLWLAVIIALGVLYVRWFVRLRRRGDKWNPLRLISFMVGLVVLFYITSGAPAVYAEVLFSVHMVDHMALTMIAPLFLVIGSPIALALRAMSSRTDGTRGPREWILTLVHSRFAAVVTHPIFAGVNFAGSIIIFYGTDVFALALRYHVGHELMIAHFLLTGYIFAVNMIGLDPLPHRATYPMRLVMLLATMVFHAFYSISLMSTEVLSQPDWFGNMGRTWGLAAIDDQHLGAGFMWGIGEVPTLLLAIGVAVGWSRSDERETRRKDREADRTGDAELHAYNEMLAQMAARDRHETRP